MALYGRRGLRADEVIERRRLFAAVHEVENGPKRIFLDGGLESAFGGKADIDRHDRKYHGLSGRLTVNCCCCARKRSCASAFRDPLVPWSCAHSSQ